MQAWVRRVVLGLANTPFCKGVLTRYGWSLGVGRFVAGETLDEALQVVRQLEARGLHVILDYLGEDISDLNEAEQAKREILRAVQGLKAIPCERYLSIKPSQLGLMLDADFCFQQVCEVLGEAQQSQCFVCLDMEGSRATDLTLQLFRRVRERFENVGLVLQAYLYRTPADLESIQPLRPTLRIVKGAYHEPPDVAHRRYRPIAEQFLHLVERQMTSGNTVAVATHDEALIREALAMAHRLGVSRERFEFQFLYGMRRDLQERLSREGYKVRVYVPYGRDWYGYFSRRLAERPANILFVLRNLFKP